MHIALAFSGPASHLLTFDRRLREAGALAGLQMIELQDGTEDSETCDCTVVRDWMFLWRLTPDL